MLNTHNLGVCHSINVVGFAHSNFAKWHNECNDQKSNATPMITGKRLPACLHSNNGCCVQNNSTQKAMLEN